MIAISKVCVLDIAFDIWFREHMNVVHVCVRVLSSYESTFICMIL